VADPRHRIEALKDEVLALHAQGLQSGDIAKRLNVSPRGVLDALSRWGVPRHKPGVMDVTPVVNRDEQIMSMSDDEIARIIAMFGIKRAAKILGTGHIWLRNVMNDRGIEVDERDGLPKTQRLERRVRELEREAKHVAELMDTIVRVTEDISIAPVPEVVTIPEASPRWDTPVDLVFHVSDMQYGERVDAEEVPGGNFSPEVFRDERLPRWEEAAQAVIEAVARQHPIDNVWVVQGGDFVEGEGVFNGQHWHLAMDAGQQVATLAPLWAGALTRTATIAKELGARRVNCVSVVGNHGVVGGRKAGAVPASLNLDYLTYKMVAGLLPNGLIDVYHDGPAKAAYFDAQGWLVLVTHGDQDRGGGLIGVPVVTGTRNDLTLRASTGIQHHLHLVGHYHRPTQVTVGGSARKLWNGDFCGANNLSHGRGGGSHPTQRAYVIHPEWGLSQQWDLYVAPHRVVKPDLIAS
jgi:DNA-binding CsgD family transcriptional regulator